MKSHGLIICAFAVLTLMALATAASPADLLLMGRADDAIATLSSRVKSAPNDAEAWHLLNRAWYAVERFDRAIDAGEKAVKLQPGNSGYHLWLGRAYGEKASNSSFITAAKITGRVRDHFERAVELDPRNIDARSDLGEFYLEAPGFMGGGTDKALKQAEQLRAQNAARGHWLQARIQEKLKNSKLAEQEYRSAIQASGNQASYWLNLASFYRRSGRLDDMEKAIDQAMAANRDKTNVLFDAAHLLYRAGRNFPSATQYVRTYLTLPPSEEAPVFEAHYLLGALLEKQGQKDQAAAEYRAALSLAHEFGPAQEALKRVSQ